MFFRALWVSNLWLITYIIQNTNWSRVGLYLDKSEILAVVEPSQTLQDISLALPVAQNNLVLTLAAWGSITDLKQPPTVTTRLLALQIESELMMLAGPVSLDVFFVSSIMSLIINWEYSF